MQDNPGGSTKGINTNRKSEMCSSESLSLPSKAGSILKMESEVRKLKQIVSIEKELRSNRQELQALSSQISHCEQQLRMKRKQALKEKIAAIEKKKAERELQNKESDNILTKIKQEHKQRRLRLESIVNLYKEEYDVAYQKKLNKRRQQMKLDVREIREHEEEYLLSRRRSYRIKTESVDRQKQNSQLKKSRKKNHQYSPSANSYDFKIQRRKELARKGRQYGQFAERAASSIRVTPEMVAKAKNFKQKHGFDDNIDRYENQKKKMEKPRLNTNFSGDIQSEKDKELKKFARKSSPVKEKLARLQNLAQGYKLKYQNGHDEALDQICSVSLLRAQLFLKDA